MRSIVAALVLLAAAASALAENAYILGVQAYGKKDYASARAHWKKATEENVRPAFNNLGFLLYSGLGGPADPERAVALWIIAAQRGERESQWHLAQAYEVGKGVQSDEVAAYAWYRCAYANYTAESLDDDGVDDEIVDDAKTAIVRLIAKLSPERIRQSELLARKYVDAYPYSSTETAPVAQSSTASKK